MKGSASEQPRIRNKGYKICTIRYEQKQPVEGVEIEELDQAAIQIFGFIDSLYKGKKIGAFDGKQITLRDLQLYQLLKKFNQFQNDFIGKETDEKLALEVKALTSKVSRLQAELNQSRQNGGKFQLLKKQLEQTQCENKQLKMSLSEANQKLSVYSFYKDFLLEDYHLLARIKESFKGFESKLQVLKGSVISLTALSKKFTERRFIFGIKEEEQLETDVGKTPSNALVLSLEDRKLILDSSIVEQQILQNIKEFQGFFKLLHSTKVNKNLEGTWNQELRIVELNNLVKKMELELTRKNKQNAELKASLGELQTKIKQNQPLDK